MNVVQSLGLQGRTSRTTFVTWLIVITIVRLALNFVLTGVVPAASPLEIFAEGSDRQGAAAIDLVATALLLLLQARRFRDQDRSGWLAIAPLAVALGATILPRLGPLWTLLAIAYLVGLFMPPTVGPNRYGPDPRGWKSPEQRAEQERQLKAGR